MGFCSVLFTTITLSYITQYCFINATPIWSNALLCQFLRNRQRLKPRQSCDLAPLKPARKHPGEPKKGGDQKEKEERRHTQDWKKKKTEKKRGGCLVWKSKPCMHSNANNAPLQTPSRVLRRESGSWFSDTCGQAAMCHRAISLPVRKRKKG